MSKALSKKLKINKLQLNNSVNWSIRLINFFRCYRYVLSVTYSDIFCVYTRKKIISVISFYPSFWSTFAKLYFKPYIHNARSEFSNREMYIQSTCRFSVKITISWLHISQSENRIEFLHREHKALGSHLRT